MDSMSNNWGRFLGLESNFLGINAPTFGFFDCWLSLSMDGSEPLEHPIVLKARQQNSNSTGLKNIAREIYHSWISAFNSWPIKLSSLPVLVNLPEMTSSAVLHYPIPIIHYPSLALPSYITPSNTDICDDAMTDPYTPSHSYNLIPNIINILSLSIN